jgi:NADP-dependent 3-hydroxy acid dehydrogenase YdfG
LQQLTFVFYIRSKIDEKDIVSLTYNTMTNVNQAEFEGKVAIVTGAASGIGRATTTLLNSCGTSVVAEDIKPEVDQLASNNERIATIVGDVSSEETAKRAVALAI